VAARDINVYVIDRDSVDIDLGEYEDRVRIHDASSRKRRPGPVIMTRVPRPPVKIMELDSPHEIELDVTDPSDLDEEAIKDLVDAVDQGGHELSIVQVEEDS
jgi:hypothetical protein